MGSPLLPSGYVKIAIENDPLIVDLPIKDDDFPYQRVLPIKVYMSRHA